MNFHTLLAKNFFAKCVYKKIIKKIYMKYFKRVIHGNALSKERFVNVIIALDINKVNFL